MDANMKYEYIDCWDKCLEKTLHKQESQDCVVPDTMPDVAQILFVMGSLLIRSKDVSSGKLKLEANIPARVVFRDEEGGINSLEVNVPVYMAAEEESLSESSLCIADMKICALEARLLNPRKLLVRAEISADIFCCNKSRLSYTVGIEDQEHIHLRRSQCELSFVSAVTEKTFALTDEQALPEGLAGGDILCSAADVFTDDIKQLGSKLIIKGRIKSRLLLRCAQQLTPLEATTDFSQIVECSGGDCDFISACLIPSGVHHYISSQEGEGRLCMEFHMVAQIKCRESRSVDCLCDAYSNQFALDYKFAEISCEKPLAHPIVRSSCRQLYEVKDLAEVLCCSHIWGKARCRGDKLCQALAVQCLYADEQGCLKSEKFSLELEFDCAGEEIGACILQNTELTDCSLSCLPGGVELRVAAQAEALRFGSGIFACIDSISFDETKPEDNSRKPSLVLLRADSSADLWTLARENCSTVAAIVEANNLDSAGEAWEKLLLIPKSL